MPARKLAPEERKHLRHMLERASETYYHGKEYERVYDTIEKWYEHGAGALNADEWELLKQLSELTLEL